MLRPTPEEVLKSISYTFDNFIRPDPTSSLAVSYSLTVSNMLRQLLLAMQREEGLIAMDTGELRAVLEQARDYLAAAVGDGAAAEEIRKALGPFQSDLAPSQAARENWRALRSTLEHTIQYLQSLRGKQGHEAGYRSVRQAIRDYLDRSLDRENGLIEGAFTLARR